ncbi:complement C3-like [Thalassophryne amazonica]|uniref:complement C3-like n=1 Tax=Thalassophryne amazonica TaxID=390379 RepID=UPI001471C8CA|nr:complement C3-like [Thalassophryne amazonica]
MYQWTLKIILFLTLFCSSDGQLGWPFDRPFDRHFHMSTKPRFTLLAPDLLRTDSPESIYLQADNVQNSITVSISIQEFKQNSMLLQDLATLSADNNFHTLKLIQLSSDQLNRDEKKNKFVKLKVAFGTYHTEERMVMVSFHSGYIFIQTDKPIYNPGDTVQYRTFVSSPSFKAFDSSITAEIKNPDGVVVKHTSRIRSHNGVFADNFPLSEIVNEGMWTVTAKFDHWQQNTFTSHFEVKKYVLPAFNVTLTPQKSFFSLDDTELSVEISAKYLYGEPVHGTAYVVFGVVIDKDKIRLPSVKQVSDLTGGVVSLGMDELKRSYPNVASLVGKSLYVKASVLTKTGSDLVEVEKTGIKIVESPFVLSFKDLPKYFKPGLPFDFTVQVTYHDGSPARNVPVKLDLLDAPLVVSSGTTRATINMPKGHRSHVINAVTAQAGLRPEQQAKHKATILPHNTYSFEFQNFLYISIGTNKVSLGERLSLKLTVSVADATYRKHVKDITYLVLSKGRIIEAQRVDVSGQVLTSVGLTVTSDMMPSFRFVAFYTIPWQNQPEVVSDSIWVDVADSCVGGLTVRPVDGIHRNYQPGKSFNFKVRGDPGSQVHLVAVDNAVYLLNKDRLTQRKIWDVVEHGDIGCTRGGGRNAIAVFTDAGLLFSSSGGVRTQNRHALRCPGSARRRRSAELLQRKAQLASHYKEKQLRRCCNDGLRHIPMPYSCTRRSLYITEGWECIRAFRYCCASLRGEVFETDMPTTPPTTTTAAYTTSAIRPSIIPMRIPLSRRRFGNCRIVIMLQDFGVVRRKNSHFSFTSANKKTEDETVFYSRRNGGGAEVEEEEEEEEEEEWEYMDESQVYLRDKFYESWLWIPVDLPSESDGSDGLASTTLSKPIPDSITEWSILAVSASPNTGFCVAEPYNIRTWKQFFVDLKLPYSVARNEQVEIKAVIHNYGYENLHVRVVLMKTEGMCSVAFKDRNTQELSLPAGSSKVVLYTIVPLVVGKLPLEVVVVGRDMMGGDRVQKHLRVVMDGVQKTKVWSAVLNPSASGGKQVVHMPKVEVESIVPNSQPETFINVRGNVLADSIDNSISDNSLAALIRMPGGCVEQNLASITLPLIATLYLDRADDWESVGLERKAEALRYIRRGYENQLAYRKSDGSYPPYRREGASTWITAYVVKVFSMAHSIVGINEQHVCEPLLYLVNNKKQSSGNFIEDNPVYSATMTGGLCGDHPDTSLTAFVLIALMEAKQAGLTCGESYMKIQSAIDSAAQYLKGTLMIPIKRPYTVAIASYALALLESAKPIDPIHQLLQVAAEGGTHWPDSENTLFTLEATGYALLALIKLGHMRDAEAAFKWLNSQRRRGGGFGSTQSTMVVLQALSEYMVHVPLNQNLNLNVDVRVPGRSEIRYHFDPSTSYAARTSRLPTGMDLEVEARGSGQGILEVVTYYNQLHEVDEKIPCRHFELNVTIEESSEKPPADVEKSYQITIKVRALGPADVRMVVLDISFPTGFTPENSDLEMLSNSVDRYINNFQIIDNLSDRGSLIIHLFKVSHKEPEILIFRLQQSFKVGLLQPSSVDVFEYYNPDHRCSRTYTPIEDKTALRQICRENVCRCTQGDCCISKSDNENFPNKERETFACTQLHHVFQVKVVSVSQSYYDKYEMEITRVIKLGIEAGVEVGQKRFFMSHGGCREGLSLQKGSQYLIIGPKEDQWNIDVDTKRYNYMLGKDTWVERWPSSAECASNPRLQLKCTSLEAATQELSVNGCRL